MKKIATVLASLALGAALSTGLALDADAATRSKRAEPVKCIQIGKYNTCTAKPAGPIVRPKPVKCIQIGKYNTCTAKPAGPIVRPKPQRIAR